MKATGFDIKHSDSQVIDMKKNFPQVKEDIAKWESADKEENVGVCSAKFILQLLERLLPCTDWPKSVFGFMAQGGSLAPLC